MLHHYLLFGLFGILVGLLPHTDARQATIAADNIESNSFPYLVSVLSHNKQRKTPKARITNICTGCIIRNDLVVSAAHCFVGNNNNFRIRPLSVKAQAVEVYVKTIYVPKSYRPPATIVADIAVLRLNDTLPHSTAIRLPTKNYRRKVNHYEGQLAEIVSVGWKQYERGDIVSVDRCQQIYRHPNVTVKQLCVKVSTGDHQSQQDQSCFGDDGGPLVQHGTIIGIVSRTPTNCSQELDVAVYTKVADYLPFIENTLNGEKNQRYTRERHIM